MKDLAAILFVAVVLSIAIYMIWKENSDRYFDSKYARKDKGRILKDSKRSASDSAKMVERKRKYYEDN